MSRKSKSTSAKKPERRRLDRPFDPRVWAAAVDLAGRYRIVLTFADGEWYGKGVELPGAMGDGRTPEECVANTRHAFAAAVATDLEAGLTPPAPGDAAARTEQVNVRLTGEEKLVLESAAQQQGFQGVADFVRYASLRQANAGGAGASLDAGGAGRKSSRTGRKSKRTTAAAGSSPA